MREDITRSFRRGFGAKPGGASTEEFGSMSFLSGFGKRRSAARRNSTGSSATAPLSWKTGWGKGEKSEEVQALEKQVATLQDDVTAARGEAESVREEVRALEGKVENRDVILRKRAVVMREQEEHIAQLRQALQKAQETVVAHDVAAEKLLAQCNDVGRMLAAAEKRVEHLERLLQAREGELTCVKGELVDREETVVETEKRVSELQFQHRPKPVRGFMKTLACAGAGALVALASAGNR